MAYELIIRDEEKALIVRYHDAVDLENRMEALTEGLKVLRAMGYRRVLVDLREASLMLQPYDAYQFGQSLAESKEMKVARTAFLVAKNDSSNSFVEIFAGNRGVLYNEFDDEEKAWQWLMQS